MNPEQTQAAPPQPPVLLMLPPPPAEDEGRRRARETWERLSGAKASGMIVQGTVRSAVRGGLLVDIEGYRGFLPASQVRLARGTAMQSLVKTTVPLKVLDVDEERKRLVVSHRRALEQSRRAARAELLSSLKVGQEREATVLRLTDFGAFVDLGGVDALIPLGEMAFERVAKASDVLNVGEHLQVRVIRIEDGGRKIAASRKATLADPWRDNAQLLRAGKMLAGKVVSKERGLEVEVAPGLIGSLGERDANPEEYEIGETIEVSVRSADFRNRRLRLSTLHATAAFTPSSTSFAPLGVELTPP